MDVELTTAASAALCSGKARTQLGDYRWTDGGRLAAPEVLLRLTASASGPLTDGHLPCTWTLFWVTPSQLCASAGRRSITLQMFKRHEATGQGEDQRFDRSGDFQTGAGRPICIGGVCSQALEQFGPGKEAVGPEIFGDGNHSSIGNAAQTPEWSADVHLVDDDVSEHGKGRETRQIGASENDASEVFKKVCDGRLPMALSIHRDISVDAESRSCESPGHFGNSHARLADHVSDDVSAPPLTVQSEGVSHSSTVSASRTSKRAWRS